MAAGADGARPVGWDESVARELVDCLVIVGLTYRYPDGSQSEQQQFFGRVVETDRVRGVRLRLAGKNDGRRYWLPPDTNAFKKAPAGQYRLRSTGEIVDDPDYTCAWSIAAPVQ